MLRPVSSQVPKDPVATLSSTLSHDAPSQANSQSWIDPAPFVARCVIQPRSIISVTIRAAPLRSRMRAIHQNDACLTRPRLLDSLCRFLDDPLVRSVASRRFAVGIHEDILDPVKGAAR
jgi:hypothetical protein